jgi:8-oxo-dGTP pyrophosphatase MutT (NUDIX family)
VTEQTTWDGEPVSGEKPRVVCVVVWRQGESAAEFLVLHRRHAGGPEQEGEWAWTPPSGARHPGEDLDAAAARELREEAGLNLHCVPLPAAFAPSRDLALYVAEASGDASIAVDEEHDRFLWLPLGEAVEKCLPIEVAACIASAADWMERQRPKPRARAGRPRSRGGE